VHVSQAPHRQTGAASKTTESTAWRRSSAVRARGADTCPRTPARGIGQVGAPGLKYRRESSDCSSGRLTANANRRSAVGQSGRAPVGEHELPEQGAPSTQSDRPHRRKSRAGGSPSATASSAWPGSRRVQAQGDFLRRRIARASSRFATLAQAMRSTMTVLRSPMWRPWQVCSGWARAR
jgi:hypothetical protein